MFDTYLELFLSHLENNNRAASTMEQYKRELLYFYSFLNEKGITDIEEVQTIHLDLYLSHLIKKKNTSTTRGKKVKTLKSFFKFLHTRKYIKENVMVAIDNIKVKDVDKKEKFVLTKKEQEKLVRVVSKHARDKEKARLMIYMMLKCALRVDELCHLKIASVDVKKKTIRVEGKGGKIRHVPLFDEMIPDYKAYMKKRKDKSEYVFINNQGAKPMTPRAVHDFVKKYIKKANIDKVIGCHALRRTAATQLLKEGARITAIQKFMGHSTIATTEMYLLESESEIQDEIRSKTKKIQAH